MPKIKAILFDMDGVLIDAKDWHYEALNQALRIFGFEISRYEHLNVFDGLPTKKKLELLSATTNLPPALHDFINEMKQKFTMNLIHLHCKPRFCHEYALSRLKNEGYKMALCSNSIRRSIEIMMQKSALEGYFEFYLSNEDVKKSKPDPEIYQKAMASLNLAPWECLIVEDNENGIKAAKASGAHVMMVREVDEVNYANIKNTIAKKEASC
ncbi:HAD family phosphatase [Campylobacter sp.]|uniref:HAD family hydrolase n=1 Tax=Campylobacter sp. TaxID=205 RepID=UPI0026DAC95B|nr:HAD family phosphatase [Campylobacter sp.]MDO4674665.1 HAD family phosphatase [Campylobacter sp.]